MLQVAFYKGRSASLVQRTISQAIRWWTDGAYSHCELVFPDGMCASSSGMDGGVRFKQIKLNPDHWDLVDVAADEQNARQWFLDHNGAKYDWRGDFSFVVRPIGHSPDRYFCSEAIGYALGFEQPWQFDPNALYAVLLDRQNLVTYLAKQSAGARINEV